MRKALVIGIDHYSSVSQLHGCVNDSYSVKSMLDRNADGSVNFSCKHLVSASPSELLSREELRDSIVELFKGDEEIALFYFAGHGHIEATGGYLCPSDVKSGHDGISISEVMILANKSKSKNKIIVLDSCYSGLAGGSALEQSVAEIAEGVTILTASSAEQYAEEKNSAGVFTSLLVDALGGAAANLVGEITPGSVYAHIDQSLGPWAQRPVFKTNVTRFVSLRKVQPPLELNELRMISELFPNPGHRFELDPAFEPERFEDKSQLGLPAPDPEKVVIFSILQKYNRVGLLIPEGAPHMWHAAMESKSVRLTALGEHYRRLSEDKMI